MFFVSLLRRPATISKDEFQVLLEDSCLVLNMKWVSRSDMPLAPDEVPGLLRVKETFREEVGPPHVGKYMGYYGFRQSVYLIEGDRLPIKCRTLAVRDDIFRIEVSCGVGEEEMRRRDALAGAVKRFKAMRKVELRQCVEDGARNQ